MTNKGIIGNVTAEALAVGDNSRAEKTVMSQPIRRDFETEFQIFLEVVNMSALPAQQKEKIVDQMEIIVRQVRNGNPNKESIVGIFSHVKTTLEAIKDFVVGAGELVEPLTKLAGLLGIVLS